MPKATFILGLCGSGKTWLADRIHAETGVRLFEGVIGKDQLPELIQWLQHGNDCVIEEISLCSAHNRDIVIRGLTQ